MKNPFYNSQQFNRSELKILFLIHEFYAILGERNYKAHKLEFVSLFDAASDLPFMTRWICKHLEENRLGFRNYELKLWQGYANKSNEDKHIDFWLGAFPTSKYPKYAFFIDSFGFCFATQKRIMRINQVKQEKTIRVYIRAVNRQKHQWISLSVAPACLPLNLWRHAGIGEDQFELLTMETGGFEKESSQELA